MKYFNLNTSILLQVSVPALFLIHGIYRVSTGIVYDFGLFFSGMGWPLGHQMAWLVTILEITTSLCIILGYWVRLSATYLFIQTLMGMILIHWSHGWFVVGAGRNGMEYSILLMFCLLHIGLNSNDQFNDQSVHPDDLI